MEALPFEAVSAFNSRPTLWVCTRDLKLPALSFVEVLDCFRIAKERGGVPESTGRSFGEVQVLKQAEVGVPNDPHVIESRGLESGQGSLGARMGAKLLRSVAGT